MSKWTQELLFVRRDDNGAITGIRDEPPEGVEYEPYEKGDEQHDQVSSTV